jgi:hypothetical protein
MNYYQRVWGIDDFNIDTTANLVSCEFHLYTWRQHLIALYQVRADWHATYDEGCWAFAPSLKVLKNMLKMGIKGSYKRVCLSLLMKIASQTNSNSSRILDTRT